MRCDCAADWPSPLLLHLSLSLSPTPVPLRTPRSSGRRHDVCSNAALPIGKDKHFREASSTKSPATQCKAGCYLERAGLEWGRGEEGRKGGGGARIPPAPTSIHVFAHSRLHSQPPPASSSPSYPSPHLPNNPISSPGHPSRLARPSIKPPPKSTMQRRASERVATSKRLFMPFGITPSAAQQKVPLRATGVSAAT